MAGTTLVYEIGPDSQHPLDGPNFTLRPRALAKCVAMSNLYQLNRVKALRGERACSSLSPESRRGVTAIADQTVAAKTIGRMSFVDSTRLGV
jgi:hypothetical protein